MSQAAALFAQNPGDYQRYRPDYPAELFSWVAQQCRQHERVLDIACGSGQASEVWPTYFQQVLACDLSFASLQLSPEHSPVLYFQSPADVLPVSSHSVDLVSVAQGLHWFATPTFYQEVRRVLRPQGIFCAWSYGLPVCANAKVDAWLRSTHDQLLGPYWPAGREHVVNGYRDVPFPFAHRPAPALGISRYWLPSELLGYISSWSATAQYRQQQGDPLPQLAAQLEACWPQESPRLALDWPITLLLGSPDWPAT
ncbi:class I SAM-dependent methyltransferase [Atopomonas hussainii]|uniref:class I SAM-dependent methyltransferase n=1 Tax=Atopomonas hussainii TaxID=1429083 RepID=UPI00090035CC|nr:class I SAM-dependent methyltransferase [Atopomonas hussainii]